MTPPGKWMPAEPTWQMTAAGRDIDWPRPDIYGNFRIEDTDPATDAIYRAMYAVASPASPWLDIASAPKDGTVVDIWVNNDHSKTYRRFADVYWDDRDWRPESDKHKPRGERSFIPGYATHWMPKPASPGTEASVPADEVTGHTPLPWRAGYDDNGFYFLAADGMPSPYIVATGGEGEADKANIALIVSAVNRPVPPDEVRKVLEPFVAEFIRRTNPGDSDLDNEQPYHLIVPLGTCRAARALLARWGK